MGLELLIIETIVLFAISDQARAPLKLQKQVVVQIKKMDDLNTMDRIRWIAHTNNDRFAPTIKCNTVLDGNVHTLHLPGGYGGDLHPV